MTTTYNRNVRGLAKRIARKDEAERRAVAAATTDEARRKTTVADVVAAAPGAQEVKSGVTTVDSFVNFQHSMGIGANSAMSSSTYGFNPITRNRTLLEWIHRGSWLGGVAVDVVAEDMTRAGVEIVSAADPDDIARIDESITALDVWAKVCATIKWSRLYGGGLCVMLIEGQDLSTPLQVDRVGSNAFRGVLDLDRWQVEPDLSNLVTELGPDLGLPQYYRVTNNAPGLVGQRIHYSRCIRLGGIKLPYQQALIENLWGISELERIYDRMVAFDSATTGATQLVYKAFLRHMKVKGLREIAAAGGDALKGLVAYTEMMRNYNTMEGMTLIDSEDDIETEVHGAFGGLSDVLAQFGQQLSGALQIPLVRLFGQSPAGFNTGDADLRNYYDGIKQKQIRDLKVGITKIYRCQAASLEIELPKGLNVEFCPLWQLGETDRANIASTTTKTIIDAEQAGLVTLATAMKELRQSSQTTGVFTNITDAMIQEAESAPPPLPEGLGEERPGAEAPQGLEPTQKSEPVQTQE